MEASKITVTITTETLSPDCIEPLLLAAAKLIGCETASGELIKDDGDCVRWSSKSKKVEF
jgi:hypothetical protein